MEVCIQQSRRFDKRGVHSWMRTPYPKILSSGNLAAFLGVRLALKRVYQLTRSWRPISCAEPRPSSWPLRCVSWLRRSMGVAGVSFYLSGQHPQHCAFRLMIH
jgi:hypothetical protein